MILTDSHAHIYLDEFHDQQEEIIQRAQKAGVAKIYMPAIDSETLMRCCKQKEIFLIPVWL